MPTQQTVLLVGGTGRTGGRVLQQLLGRGISVRAIVRSAGQLPPGVVGHPNLTVTEASLLSLSDGELQGHLGGCDAVISCLGHTLNLKGIFGSPRDLVTRATTRLCRGIEALAAMGSPSGLRPEPTAPVKFILMSSVSVHRTRGHGQPFGPSAGDLDTRRGSFERGFLWLLRLVLPPAKDNQRAAELLLEKIGPNNPFVQWAVVRPDSLLEGDVSEYTVHEGLVNSLFKPGSTNMANVAHFMCELVANEKRWTDWKCRLPVIINAPSKPT